MTRLHANLTVAVLCLACPVVVKAQETNQWKIQAGEPGVSWDLRTGIFTATNGVQVEYKGSVLTAQSVSGNQQSGETVADGHVRIYYGDQIWVGEHIVYNFKTHEMASQEFRSGKPPVFVAGEGLHGIATNGSATGVYTATNALITTDDVSRPAIKLRATRIKIIPGQRVEAWNATLYLGDVPVFYFPYYSRNLGARANNLNVVPGYRSSFGPFLLTDYRWFWNEELDGALHLDYREKRGIGVGPDLNYHLGRWGDGTFRYYYLDDHDAGTNLASAPLPENRQRVYFSYLATPVTNLEVRSLVRYQQDSDIVKNFFESEYRQNPQPDSFFEANKFWQNFSLDVYAQPQVNDYLETVERLPEVRLTGFRQQLGNSPLYYESESSAGYYRRRFPGASSPFPAATNSPFGETNNFSAARADTYHQITLPETFFGWLNVTPRVGGRFTYYSAVSGLTGADATVRTNSDTFRGVFNTGAEVSFKASRLWPGAQNKFLELDGLRHIVEPSINYVYVPAPNYTPNQLPQFDYELPSLRLLPVEFPEYNSIDSIDSQNVLRFGLGNKLQTKRAGQVDDFLNWQVLTDWRLRPSTNQSTFADVYSDLILKPRSWLSLESETRFDVSSGNLRMALHTLTLQPNSRWSWSLGHFYLRDDFSSLPTALGEGENVLTSSLYYRVNENWGLRAIHHFDARDGRMQEQDYTVYRDLRSWTAALTVGLRDNVGGPSDFIVAFTFSLKALPHFGLGSDTGRPYSLLGGG